MSTCKHCGKERIIATSSTTGCCDGERSDQNYSEGDDDKTFLDLFNYVSLSVDVARVKFHDVDINEISLRASRIDTAVLNMYTGKLCFYDDDNLLVFSMEIGAIL